MSPTCGGVRSCTWGLEVQAPPEPGRGVEWSSGCRAGVSLCPAGGTAGTLGCDTSDPQGGGSPGVQVTGLGRDPQSPHCAGQSADTGGGAGRERALVTRGTAAGVRPDCRPAPELRHLRSHLCESRERHRVCALTAAASRAPSSPPAPERAAGGTAAAPSLRAVPSRPAPAAAARRGDQLLGEDPVQVLGMLIILLPQKFSDQFLSFSN